MSIHDGHRRRMKGEFLARPGSFPDHKLLEMLLFYVNPRGDTNPLAHDLIDRFGSLSGVLDALPEELEKVPGVGEHAVTLLKLSKEVAKRYLTARTSIDEVVQTTEEAYVLMCPYFFGARSEQVCVMCLDGKGKNLGIRQISEGSVNAVEMTTRKVVEASLSLNAAKVVLAHNHVSGLAIPSPEDKLTTRHLARVLAEVGIELLDHLIFTDDDMVSLKDSGFEFYA